MAAGVIAGACHRWNRIPDGYFEVLAPLRVQGVYRGPAQEECLMLVVPKYTPGSLVFQVYREGQNLDVKYLASGGTLCLIPYRSKRTVLDLLTDIKNAVDGLKENHSSKQIEVMVGQTRLQQTTWKQPLKTYFRETRDATSSTESDAPLPVSPERSKVPSGGRKVLKRPAVLKKPSRNGR